jgi:hypothetical protein
VGDLLATQDHRAIVVKSLFTNISYMACFGLTGIGAGRHYGFSLDWQTAVASPYTLSYDRQGRLAGLAAIVSILMSMMLIFTDFLPGPLCSAK